MTIKYSAENNRLFEIVYVLHDVIPSEYFERYPVYTEFSFLYSMFEQNSGFGFCGKVAMIWSTDFLWTVNGIPFTLMLDEDYGFVYFLVDDPDMRESVAESIKNVIEQNQIGLLREN